VLEHCPTLNCWISGDGDRPLLYEEVNDDLSRQRVAAPRARCGESAIR
jgi:hypothetical protein